jgi:predicted alpha/beta-fold hydrolase
VQTMIGNLPFIQWLTRRRGLALLANAREWLLDCGDGVRLQGFLSLAKGNGRANEVTVEPGERQIALVLHGWEGSAESCYVLSLGARLLASGFDVLRLNLRDHGESHHLNRGGRRRHTGSRGALS